MRKFKVTFNFKLLSPAYEFMHELEAIEIECELTEMGSHASVSFTIRGLPAVCSSAQLAGEYNGFNGFSSELIGA